jgi:integrase
VRFYLDKDLLPELGDRPASDIKRSELVELLRKLEQREAFNVAKKSRGWLNQIFRYALVKGVIETNPATDLDVVAARGPKTRHHAHIAPSALPAFLKALELYDGGYQTKQAIKLLLLTGVRPGELRHARWAELDLDADLWSIPGERMKMRRPHAVPLPVQAVAILRELHALTGSSELVFPSRDHADAPMSDGTINAAIRRIGFKQTGHGFRHLLSTMLNEQGYNRDWIERQLAHGDADEVRGIYNHAAYIEPRRKMMQAWADYLDTLRDERKVIGGNFGKAA